MRQFPPPALDAQNSWFAVEASADLQQRGRVEDVAFVRTETVEAGQLIEQRHRQIAHLPAVRHVPIEGREQGFRLLNAHH